MNYGKNSEFKGRTSFIKAPRLSASELTRGALVAAVAFVLGACRLKSSHTPQNRPFLPRKIRQKYFPKGCKILLNKAYWL